MVHLDRNLICDRVKWAVLDWNTPAISSYERLEAKLMKDCTIVRLTGAVLE